MSARAVPKPPQSGRAIRVRTPTSNQVEVPAQTSNGGVKMSGSSKVLFGVIGIILVAIIVGLYLVWKKSGKGGKDGKQGPAGSPGLPGSPGPTGPTGPAGENAPAQTVGLVGMTTLLKDPLQGSTGGETIIGPFSFIAPQTGLYNITFSVNVSPGKGPAVSLTGNLVKVPGNIATKAVFVYSTAPSSLSSSAITITGSTQQSLNAGDLAYPALVSTAPYTVYTINNQGSWFQYMLI